MPSTEQKGSLVGLTGNIAAGKTAVAQIFGRLGCAVVDADQVSREVMVDPELVQRLTGEFGPQVLDSTGGVDRAALGSLIFADAGARARLEAITHPAIAVASEARFENLWQQGRRLVMYEAALLVETGRYRQMDALVVVVAPQGLRLERLMKRSGLDRRAAQRRLAAQLPQREKAALADHLIDNSGTIEQTRGKVAQVWGELQARFCAPPGREEA